MKLTSPAFWIGAASISVVVLVAVVDARRAAPGEIARVHGRESDLQGRSGCKQCHGGWFADMTESCNECHDPIAADMENKAGVHGLLAPELVAECGTCHDEHHGADFELVNARSFALAGIEDVERFDHCKVGFDMNGAHLELDCVQCHEYAWDDDLPAGAQRFRGLDQDCGTCHADPHDGRMQIGCTTCHGQERWDGLHSVGHERFLPLVGGHGDVGCRECHAKDEPHSLEVLGERRSRPAPRECIDCHVMPHAPEFVEGVARLASCTEGATCVTCHQAEHTSFRDPALATLITPEQHAVSGFRLDAPHHEAECATCHAPEELEFEARYPQRDADTCSVCHEDVHGGQFAEGPFARGDCLACHGRLAWEPHEFDLADHAKTRFELVGAHTERECRDCHVDPPEGTPRGFHGTERVCEACHDDAHEGFFAAVTDELPALDAGECSRCHGNDTFADVPPAVFDHERFTGFAVDGAHAQAECTVCHPLADEPDELGRRFGRVAEHFGEFSGCVTCHEDPHGGVFDRSPALATFGGREDCARCHDGSSFRALVEPFDHGRWTGFALVEEHAAAACTACHAPLRRADELGRTLERANGPACADCHLDPHAGQFRVDGRTDCARCHTSGAPDYLRFDHERDARFALGEQHADLECSACHEAVDLADGREAVRYRPLPTTCVECHGVHEDVLLRKKTRRKE